MVAKQKNNEQGRGIVHAEMPYGKENGHGLQLWVNLKAKDKMIEPAYQVGVRSGDCFAACAADAVKDAPGDPVYLPWAHQDHILEVFPDQCCSSL